jgi:5-methylcytosine-specific restriction protein A
MSKSNWSTGSRHARGYGTAWGKLRLYVLHRDHGLCQCSQCKGVFLTQATEVNHIVPKAEAQRKGWTQQQMDDPSNLQAVAHECHLRITAEQQGKEHRSKVQIGIDGYPINEMGRGR